MYELKTKETDNSVIEFIENVTRKTLHCNIPVIFLFYNKSKIKTPLI